MEQSEDREKGEANPLFSLIYSFHELLGQYVVLYFVPAQHAVTIKQWWLLSATIRDISKLADQFSLRIS